ncbi:MAG: hypothetical protein JOZ69_20785 [Myxococcales bacterium]|nr:hypothetical protein [Myxococcales bacterium]
MSPRKNKPSADNRQEELEKLIQAQRKDARSSSGDGASGSPVDGSFVTRDGAIRGLGHALRDLVAPAPDELLTQPPEDDAVGPAAAVQADGVVDDTPRDDAVAAGAERAPGRRPSRRPAGG